MLLENAGQVVIASAQLDDTVLRVFEQLCDTRALLIKSEHKPADKRGLWVHETRESWRFALVEYLQQHLRLWITTSAQQAGMANSAQNIARLVREHWPEARVLVVDSETMADPGHDASRLAAEPVAIASVYDVVISTPAVSSGLSVEGLEGHFAAVFSWSGGTMDAVSLVQAMGRVRDNCPRHLYAAERSPGNALRVGSGACNWRQLLMHLGSHSRQLALMLAAANWRPDDDGTGPWLRTWGRFAADQNATCLAYRSTVVALLEAEGYRKQELTPLTETELEAAKTIGERLKAHAEASQQQADQELLATPLISDEEASQLKEEKRELTAGERSKLKRWGVNHSWGLKEAQPTPELLKAQRDGLHRKLRFRWLVETPDTVPSLVSVDERKLKPLAVFTGRFDDFRTGEDDQPLQLLTAFAPDLCRTAEAPRVQLAKLLKLDWWSQRTDSFTWTEQEPTADDPDKDQPDLPPNDPALLDLETLVKRHASEVAQVLGVKVTEQTRATTVLRALLALVGCKLTAKRQRFGTSTRVYAYRVERLAAPKGADYAEMVKGWEAQLGWGEAAQTNVYAAQRSEVFKRLDQGEAPERIPFAKGLIGRGWVATWRRLRGVPLDLSRESVPKFSIPE